MQAHRDNAHLLTVILHVYSPQKQHKSDTALLLLEGEISYRFESSKSHLEPQNKNIHITLVCDSVKH